MKRFFLAQLVGLAITFGLIGIGVVYLFSYMNRKVDPIFRPAIKFIIVAALVLLFIQGVSFLLIRS